MTDNRTSPGAIAIVGMAGRFPGARDTTELWQRLLEGKESVRRFEDHELQAAGVPAERADADGYVRRGADLADADLFDARFFDVTQRDAKLMDPQQRIFLTCAWRAMEDAGLAPGPGQGPVGVFAGTSMSTYLLSNVLRCAEFADAALTYPVLLGNDKDFLATRVSYKLNLRGPALSVQSACSSSLTAVHLACAALERGEITAALAGGVSITVPQTSGYRYQQGGIMSPDGHCRPFDADAAGTVKGNGCGVVVLKRLEDALADGDRVYAVIRGIAVNNDGSEKIGFTAPGPAGQQEVIRAALESSGLDARDIGYVEAHGTGTAVGDPLELMSLTRAYRAAGGPAPDCRIGSVKANLGHLDAAAGVTGLIKTALVLHHQTVPPQINFDRPSPHAVGTLPFTVPTEPTRYEDAPLAAAAVSSFGLGGTNVHCVLQAAPAPTVPAEDPGAAHPVVLSARDADALRTTATELLHHLADDTTAPSVRDLAYTLFTGRARMAVTHVLNATTLEEVRAGLRKLLSEPGLAQGQAPAAWPGSPGRKVSLPGHPLNEQSHWIQPDLRLPETGRDSAPPSPTAGRPAPAPVPRGAGRVDPAQVLTRVLAVLEQHLDLPDIAPHDDFYDLGGDSMLAVEVTTCLCEEFDVDLGYDEFTELHTPEQMAKRLCALLAGESTTSDGLVTLREGTGRPLHLVHPAGGTNFIYTGLVAHSQSAVPLTALSFPGDVSTAPTSLRGLAALYLERIRRRQPEGPYRLGGYSFGGNVAYEMALQLQAAGEEVETLVLFDSYPPETYVGRHLSDDEFADAFPLLLDAVGEDGLDARELREKGFYQIWKHNYDLLKGHYPDQRFRGDLVLLRAEEGDSTVRLDTALRMNLVDKSLWEEHVTGRLTVRKVLGDHFSMFADGEPIAALAAAFDEAVADFDRADAHGTGQQVNRPC
ncbi:beta-ketoacyl synthase N-terminal-like domain-containing protein [Streptomyces sp. NPDC088760]|uniref:beta-ketoacyl synthase N-terminal-like domain-containing protein n=1 Tax=Streptomyces sp. NPDC088760 TaxID=3365890 RepID=UPI0037F7B9F2